MYYFYIVKSSNGRIGFGIAKDYEERNRQYCSHSGDVIVFPYVFGGKMNAAKALENSIKRELVDDRWDVEGWRTEWFNDYIKLDDFINIVKQKISDRRYDLEIVAENFSISA